MITGTYDDIDPSIVYLVDSPLRREFEEYVKSYCKQWEVEFILAKCNDGEYESNETDWQWIGYHDRALQENLKLRDTPAVRGLSNEDITLIACGKMFITNSQIVNFAREILTAAKGNP